MAFRAIWDANSPEIERAMPFSHATLGLNGRDFAVGKEEKQCSGCHRRYPLAWYISARYKREETKECLVCRLKYKVTSEDELRTWIRSYRICRLDDVTIVDLKFAEQDFVRLRGKLQHRFARNKLRFDLMADPYPIKKEVEDDECDDYDLCSLSQIKKKDEGNENDKSHPYLRTQIKEEPKEDWDFKEPEQKPLPFIFPSSKIYILEREPEVQEIFAQSKLQSRHARQSMKRDVSKTRIIRGAQKLRELRNKMAATGKSLEDLSPNWVSRAKFRTRICALLSLVRQLRRRRPKDKLLSNPYGMRFKDVLGTLANIEQELDAHSDVEHLIQAGFLHCCSQAVGFTALLG